MNQLAFRKCLMLVGLALPLSVMANEKGAHVVSVGTALFFTNENSSSLNLGGVSIPGSSSSIKDTGTLLLTYSHYFEDNFALDVIGGLPPKFAINAEGTAVKALGVTSIGSVHQYQPAIMARYVMGSKNDNFRPYVGIGVTYAFYDKIKLDPKFEEVLKLCTSIQVANRVCDKNAQVEGRLSRDFKPVAGIGVTYKIGENLGLTAGVNYTPLKTKATIKTKFSNGEVMNSGATVDLNPIIGNVLLNYVF